MAWWEGGDVWGPGGEREKAYLRLCIPARSRAKYVIFGSRFTTSPNCVCVGSANISREPCREPRR